jgi:hypothetical protein
MVKRRAEKKKEMARLVSRALHCTQQLLSRQTREEERAKGECTEEGGGTADERKRRRRS